MVGHQLIELMHRDGAPSGRLEIDEQTFASWWTGKSRNRNKESPCSEEITEASRPLDPGQILALLARFGASPGRRKALPSFEFECNMSLWSTEV